MTADIAYWFPDWKEMKPGSWSRHVKFMQYGDDKVNSIEINLYREPIDESEISGTYTLQIFQGDDVIVCETVK